MIAAIDLNALPVSTIAAISFQLARPETAQALVANYAMFNHPVRNKILNPLMAIYNAACEIGHNRWPNQIRDLVIGKRILDVGCGTTLYGAVFRALGATSYVGVDPRIHMKRKQFRSRLGKGSVRTNVSLTSVVSVIPNVEYHAEVRFDSMEWFDLAVMHTVTEHLADPDSTFATVARLLRPGGKIWFLHDNFYSWAGHHMPPHSLKGYLPDDPDHRLYADWKHVKFEPDENHPFRTNLNRLRLDDLRGIVERYFVIEEWQEVEDSARVRERLTPAIEAELADYTRRDLLVKHVICQGTRL